MSDLRYKNLIKYVLPTVLSMVCFFMFTIIDGIFVGRGVGPDGLGAVNLVLPFVMIVDAVVMLIVIGGSAITAIRFGEGNVDGANQAFMHSVIGTSAAAVILCLVGVLFAGPACTFLGADGTFHQLATEYMFWYSVFIIPASLSTLLQGFCRNDGSPVLVSAAVIISTVFNIFGDWFLVFPMHMGMKGAAIATGVSQTIALLIVLTHYLPKTKGQLYFHRPDFDPSLIHEIAVRGMPGSVSKLSTPVMTFCLNRVLINMIGDIGVNAFSIISYVASFSMAIFMGTGDGIQPLIGQSYGMRQKRDMKFYFHQPFDRLRSDSVLVSEGQNRPRLSDTVLICQLSSILNASLDYIILGKENQTALTFEQKRQMKEEIGQLVSILENFKALLQV